MTPLKNQKCRALLFEAFRRNDMADPHEKSKPLHKRWLGLGTATLYKDAIKAGLFAWVDDEPPSPRCSGWLHLTPHGVEVFTACEIEFSGALERLQADPLYQRARVSQYTLLRRL